MTPDLMLWPEIRVRLGYSDSSQREVVALVRASGVSPVKSGGRKTRGILRHNWPIVLGYVAGLTVAPRPSREALVRAGRAIQRTETTQNQQRRAKAK